MYYSHLIILLFLYYCYLSKHIFLLKATSLVQVGNLMCVGFFLLWKWYFNKRKTNINRHISAEMKKRKGGEY